MTQVRFGAIAVKSLSRRSPARLPSLPGPMVVLAVPYEGQDELVSSLDLAGRIVISCVNPLAFDQRGPWSRHRWRRRIRSRERAGARTRRHRRGCVPQRLRGRALGRRGLYEDIVVVGDSPEAKQVAIDLATAVRGRPGIDGGKLRLARILEPLTAVLISINRRYKVHSRHPNHRPRHDTQRPAVTAVGSP